MLEEDQSMRLEAMAIAEKRGRSSPEYAQVRERGIAMDRAHLDRLVQVVEQYGWPGIHTVGEAACNGAFLVLQHGDLETQSRFLPLVRSAAERGEIKKSSLALLEDRVRMLSGLGQLYGTQIVRGADGKPEPWRIEDDAHVEERRASVGLEPLAVYLERFLPKRSPDP